MLEDNKWPRWRYHQTECPEGKIVHSLEECKGLGEGWVDSPAQFGEIKCPVLEVAIVKMPEKKKEKEKEKGKSK